MTDIGCQFIFGGGGLKWAGDSLVLMDQCAPGAPMGIVVFSFLTGQKRCLDSPQAKELGDFGLAVSPDQKSVVFARQSTLGVSGPDPRPEANFPVNTPVRAHARTRARPKQAKFAN